MRFFIAILIFSVTLIASTLQLATSTNPSRLNPLLATDSSSSEIAGFIFNGLLKYDIDSKDIICDLADKFYFSDEKTLVFELKKGVQWQDGAEFSAEDVLFTYKVLISDNIASPYSSDFRFVKDVIVLDKYKLKVIYTKPYFKALEIWMMGILPKHILKDEKNLMNSKFNTNPIGTGPYKLSKLEYSKNIELIAFDNYFEGKAKIDKISFNVIADPMTRFMMLKSLQLDLGSIDPMQYERQLNNEFFKKFNTYEKISRAYTYLGFNMRLEKFKNPKIRRALSLAIDRQELVDILFFKHAKVCSGPFLPGTKAFNSDIKVPKQDIKKAKQLLKEAGYDEEHPFSFEIVTSNSNSVRPYAAQILQYQLKKVGVIVTLRVMEWQAFLNMVVFPKKFDSVLLGWGLSPTPDPYAIWHKDGDKPGGFNFIGYNNKKVNKLIEESQGIVDRDILYGKFRKIFKLIVEDNPYLFLYIPNSITAVNKDIKNVKEGMNGIWYDYIKWEKQ